MPNGWLSRDAWPTVFVLETDWSGDFSGYLLFARQNYLEKSLVDLGSKVAIKAASSYLGELDTIIWACKKTKAVQGRSSPFDSIG